MRSSRSLESDAIVLLSGGIDSTACVHFFLNEKHSVEALFVDYGQAARKREEKAASVIAASFGVPLRKLRIGGATRKDKGLIQGRNALLILCALMEFEQHPRIIVLGIHKGTAYWDCTSGFMELMQSLMDAYSKGCVQLMAPFLEWTKREIWLYCQEHRVPTHLTYSCERGGEQPCGRCLSCKDLEALNAGR